MSDIPKADEYQFAEVKPSTYTNYLVQQMFLETADHNYIVARWSFMNKLATDFFFMAAQSVEKYLKSILLFNGRSSKGFGHDLCRLNKEVLSLSEDLSFGPLLRPEKWPEDLYWRDECATNFVNRINNDGDPNNRYMIYGWVCEFEDLFKFDQLIWSIRRHCRPFEHKLENEYGYKKTIYWVQQLLKQPEYWRIQSNLPIEKVVDGKYSGSISDALLDLNFAFAPDRNQKLSRLHSSSRNPPLANLCNTIRSDDASPCAKSDAKRTLKWVLEMIQLKKEDAKTIESLLKL